MKRFILISLILLLIPAAASGQQIKIKGGGISNGRATIKTEIKGHKLTIRTPKLTKNKYIKLVNIMY